MLGTPSSYCGNSKPDLYTRTSKGKSHRDPPASRLLVMQTDEEHGQGVALRFVEYRQEIGSAHGQEIGAGARAVGQRRVVMHLL